MTWLALTSVHVSQFRVADGTLGDELLLLGLKIAQELGGTAGPDLKIGRAHVGKTDT